MISDLAGLERLFMVNTRLSDAGLRELARLHYTLSSLNVSSRVGDITDRGLKHIERMSQLRHLDISGSRVTDSGAKSLRLLKKLHHLVVQGTQMTESCIHRLREKMPQVRVDFA